MRLAILLLAIRGFAQTSTPVISTGIDAPNPALCDPQHGGNIYARSGDPRYIPGGTFRCTQVSAGAYGWVGAATDAQGNTTFTGNVTVGTSVLDPVKGAILPSVSFPSAGLVAKYDFIRAPSGVSGFATTLIDHGPNSLNGTFGGTPTWNAAGNAIAFNGTTDYIDLGNNAALNITGPITFGVVAQSSVFPSAGTPTIDIFGKGYLPPNEGYELAYAYTPLATAGIASWSTFAGTYNGSPHQATALSSNSIDVSQWHYYVGVYTGTAWILYVDGVPRNRLVDAAGPISTTAKAGIGAFHLSGTWSRFFTGSMAYAHVSNVAWSATDVESAYLYMVRSLAPRGIAFPSSGVVAPPSNIVFDGDSLTFGYSLVPVSFDTKYPTLVARSYAPNPAWANIGIPSQTMRTMAAGVAANIVPLYQPRAKTNVLVVWAGTNDILAGTTAAVTHGYLQTYCLAAQAAGWKVVVLTMLPAASPSTVRDPTAYNTLIRANWTGYANALADVGADSRLSTTSATYFQADNLHINGSGMSVVAGIVQAAINSVVTP